MFVVRLGLLVVTLCASVLGLPAQGLQQETAAAFQAPVTRIFLSGPLDPAWLAHFQRALRLTEAAGGDTVILELDTPGGGIERMRHLCYAIDEARAGGMRVVAWINDDALSAGSFIAISCDKVYMRTSATIGSAQAVRLTPLGMEAVEEKFASSFRAWVRGWAEKHGRSPAIAEAMVDVEAEVREVRQDGARRILSGDEWDDLVDSDRTPELIAIVNHRGELMALTGSEAVRLDFADGLAETLEEVLEKIGAAGAPVATIERSNSEEILGRLNELRLLLLFLGLLFAFAEIKLPGFGLPGILALVCFVVLFTAQYLVGLADVAHIVMAVVGFGLVATELLVLPGTIWVGLLGMMLLVVSVLMAQAGPGTDFSNALDRDLMMQSFFNTVLTGVASMVGMYAMTRFLPDTPILRRLVLLPERPAIAGEALPEAVGVHSEAARTGAPGTAVTDLRPVGKVTLDSNPGHEYEARSAGGALDRGVRVRVVSVSTGRLVVDALERSGPATEANPPNEMRA